MQYIKKQNTAPQDWDSWFARGDGASNVQRSYIYNQAHPDLKKYLLEEQNGLCAYCQQKININTSSVEHVFPQSLNEELSTNYHNLVLVCSGTAAGEKHCDKARGNQFIINLIFSNLAGLHIKNQYDDTAISALSQDDINSLWHNIRLNVYFEAQADGQITKPYKPNTDEPHLNEQIDFFINILNLNHSQLVAARKNAIKALDDAKPNHAKSKVDIQQYWK
jgi:uncharacterized protein (TIGR02646 family)